MNPAPPLPPQPLGPEWLAALSQPEARAAIARARMDGTDAAQLAMRWPALAPGTAAQVPAPWAAEQLALQQRALAKGFHAWVAAHCLWERRALEQATPAAVAHWHAKRFASGPLHIDLSAGLGADILARAAATTDNPAIKLVAVDMHAGLCNLLRHNAALLGANVEVVCATAEDYLAGLGEGALQGATVFLDPDRRADSARDVRAAQATRTHNLEGTTPDAATIVALALQLGASRVLVKASPMLGLMPWPGGTALQMPNGTTMVPNEAWVASLMGEVKEVLLVYTSQGRSDTYTPAVGVACLRTVDLAKGDADGGQYSVYELPPMTSLPNAEIDGAFASTLPAYLYAPDAALDKSGLSPDLAAHLGLAQMDAQNRLFGSDTLIAGNAALAWRAHRVLAGGPFSKGDMKKALQAAAWKRCALVIRGFPMKGEPAARALVGLPQGDGQTVIFWKAPNGTPWFALAERLRGGAELSEGIAY